MPLQRFKLINASERAWIAEQAGIALAAWRQAWIAQPAPVASVTCGPAAERQNLHDETGWLAFAASGGTLYVAAGESAFGCVLSAIAGDAVDPVPDDSSMAAGVARAGLNDLMERLANATPGEADMAPPAALWLRGSGAAWVSLPLPDGDIVVVFDGELVSALLSLLPRPVRRSAGLANPAQCIGRQRVEVRVWLGSADIELATLGNLALNDVLLLDSRIDRPLRITVAGKEAAPRAVLGYSEQHKAMRLTTFAPNT